MASWREVGSRGIAREKNDAQGLTVDLLELVPQPLRFSAARVFRMKLLSGFAVKPSRSQHDTTRCTATGQNLLAQTIKIKVYSGTPETTPDEISLQLPQWEPDARASSRPA